MPQSSERATSAVTVPGTALPALREFDAKIRGEYPAPAVVWKGDAGRKITGAYFQRAFFGPRPDQRSQIAGKEPPDPLIGFPDDLGRQVLRDVQRRALFQHQGHFLAQQTADQFLDSGRRRGRTRRRIQYRMHHQRYVRLARIVHMLKPPRLQEGRWTDPSRTMCHCPGSPKDPSSARFDLDGAIRAAV